MDQPDDMPRSAIDSSRGVLRRDADGLSLVWPGDVPPFRLTLNHLDLRPGSRDRSRKQPLGRALGRSAKTVVDATAGFGRDAVLIAAMGYEVLALERDPAVFALLEDALERAGSGDIPADVLQRIALRCDDSAQALADLSPAPDVVYLDPMFPAKEKRGSALPKRWAQALRELVDVDPSGDAVLFDAARRAARQRVVVKRRDDGLPLARADFSITGKTVRYDVYAAS